MQWTRVFATLGPLGYFPAPGTVASCAALVPIWFFKKNLSQEFYMVTVGCSILIAYGIINHALCAKNFTQHDPSEIVLDEVVGCMVVFLGCSLNFFSIVMGLLLFRIFDVTKWGPVGWAERIKGAGGILADDIVAGLIVNVLLRCIV